MSALDVRTGDLVDTATGPAVVTDVSIVHDAGTVLEVTVSVAGEFGVAAVLWVALAFW
jgi:hypothetical protein